MVTTKAVTAMAVTPTGTAATIGSRGITYRTKSGNASNVAPNAGRSAGSSAVKSAVQSADMNAARNAAPNAGPRGGAIAPRTGP